MMPPVLQGMTLGGDPELGLRHKGVHRTIPNSCYSNTYGQDHGGRVGELRPTFAKTPSGFVAHTKKAMEGMITSLRSAYGTEAAGLTLHAGARIGEDSLGGHIHLGHSKILEHSEPVQTALNACVSPVVMLLDNKDDSIFRRAMKGYGQLGELRGQPYGIEYRTPSSWLVSPRIAYGVLSLTYLVAKNAYSTEAFKEIPPITKERFRAYAKMDAIRKLEKIDKVLHTLEDYQKHAAPIQYIFQKIASGYTYDCSKDILPSWRLATHV